MQFTASLDLFEQKLRIKLDDSHRQGANLAGREMIVEIDFRDLLSARQDEQDGKTMHLWSFKRNKVTKKCCGGGKNRYVRKLEVSLIEEYGDKIISNMTE